MSNHYTNKIEYYAKVDSYTRQSYNDFQHIIDPENLRGRNHQLDHIYSVNRGYNENIDPAIIGHCSNLQVIPSGLNNIKNDKCGKSIERLYEDYESNIVNDPHYDHTLLTSDHNRALTKEQLVNAARLIKQGNLKKVIASTYGVTVHTLIRLLKREGLFEYTHPVDLTNSDMIDVLEMRKNKLTLSAIASKYGMNRQRLSRMIKKYEERQ